MRGTILSVIVLSAFASLSADEDEAVRNAEATHVFARHSFVAWDSAAVNQFLDLRNSQLFNQVLARIPQTPFIPSKPTLRTARALETGFSVGMNRGLISSGPSRANFTLTYVGDSPVIDSAAVTTSANSVTSATQYYLGTGYFADKNDPAKLSRLAFQYDHELYFARPRLDKPLAGLGVVMGVNLSRDRMEMNQVRFGQSSVAFGAISTSGTYSPNAFHTREISSEILAGTWILGLSYRASLTNRLILDSRIAQQTIAYSEGSTNTKGYIVTTPSATGGISILPINKIKARIRYTMNGTGSLVGAGVTYKLTDSLGIRAHYEDRSMRYKIQQYRITPDAGTLASNLPLLTSGGANMLFMIVGDLGPVPVEQTDRMRSGGFEFQYSF